MFYDVWSLSLAPMTIVTLIFFTQMHTYDKCFTLYRVSAWRLILLCHLFRFQSLFLLIFSICLMLFVSVLSGGLETDFSNGLGSINIEGDERREVPEGSNLELTCRASGQCPIENDIIMK